MIVKPKIYIYIANIILDIATVESKAKAPNVLEHALTIQGCTPNFIYFLQLQGIKGNLKIVFKEK